MDALKVLKDTLDHLDLTIGQRVHIRHTLGSLESNIQDERLVYTRLQYVLGMLQDIQSRMDGLGLSLSNQQHAMSIHILRSLREMNQPEFDNAVYELRSMTSKLEKRYWDAFCEMI